LEDETGKLKKLLTAQMLDNAMLRDINSKKMVTPAVRRQAVVHLCEAHAVSQRRACDVLEIDRSTVRYLSRRGGGGELRDAIKRVSRERLRFGCRRIHVMIAREGFAVNDCSAVHVYMHERAQESKAHLPRREASAAPQRQQEARFVHKQANGAAEWPEPALELRCRIRCADRRTSRPHSGRRG
jgi:hypothetical protein